MRRCQLNHLLACQCTVATAAVQPKLEHFLLANPHLIVLLLLVLEDLLSAKFNRCYQLEFPEKVADSVRCATQHNFDESTPVSSAHEQLALDEDRRSYISVRGISDGLNTD